MSRPDEYLGSLVDESGASVSPEIFWDDAIYAHEAERVFLRSWLFLAHESQIPNPHDFFTTHMGEDPVLVCRQPDGSVRAMVNACRHRGMPVCRADCGNTRSFTCSYHGWTYDSSGRLINVAAFDDGYRGELDLSSWGLIPVPRVAHYKGLIFGCFDPDTPALTDYLGDMAWYLDCLVDRREGGTEVMGGVHKIRQKGNWKLAAEQFVGDNYHAGSTHSSAFAAWRGPRDVTRARPRPPLPEGRQFSSPLGHGVAGFYLDDAPTDAIRKARGRDAEVLNRYHDSILPEVRNRLGAERAGGPAVGAALVFPNCSYLANIFGSSSIGVFHPRGPRTFDWWRVGIVDAAAPAEVKAAATRMIHVWPIGLADADDGENWSGIDANLRSPTVRRHPFNVSMGLGHERDDDPVHPGTVGLSWVGETGQRGFYRRWRQCITTPEGRWPEPA